MKSMGLKGLAIALAVCVGVSTFAGGPLGWSPDFGAPGVSGGWLGTEVTALAVFDDGHGPGVYVAGNFMIAGTVRAENIARWDGAGWDPLGGGVDDRVFAFATFDDGGGPALYLGGEFPGAGGLFVRYIAKWDGHRWFAVGGGVQGYVDALGVFDDGTGPALYVGGEFRMAGGINAERIAKWDGTAWSALGTGMWHPDFEPSVNALAVFDDGTGPALYAGGHFAEAGGVEAWHIAKWNGTAWWPVGDGTSGDVVALTVFDDGTGPALYAGGLFSHAGDLPVYGIAKWDGQQWSALAGGMDAPVHSLGLWDDGDGLALYAGGDFTTAGGVPAMHLARWDGLAWSALGTGTQGYVYALTGVPDGPAPGLYIGGSFSGLGGVGAICVAKWDGTAFSPLTRGNGLSGSVWTLAVADDGQGPALYAGGAFGCAGAAPANSIARWDGTGWLAPGTGLGAYVYAITSFDDGRGPAVYAGGSFLWAGDLRVNRIARWDGTSWSALGTGMVGTSGHVWALADFDDGHGAALYVGGQFTTAGGISANRIARWDGANWAALGAGISGGPYPAIWNQVVFDDGHGPALYVGGYFTTAGSITVNGIARWDGTTWSGLAGGVGPADTSAVSGLAVFDDGSGPALYAGGWFSSVGGVAANNVARWDGQRWWPLGDGVNDYGVYALTVFDDGGGPALYATGYFTHAGGVSARHIARWDGRNWSALGAGLDDWGYGLAGFDDGSGPALFVGGDFLFAGGRASAHIAKWGPGAGPLLGDTNCDSAVDWRDVDPFVLALSDRAAYEAEFPDCDWLNADCNADGLVDFADIDPLVVLLGGG